MNKKLLVSLPLTVLLIQGAPDVTAQDECERIDVPPVCQDARRITINNQTYRIAPLNICAAAGDEIEVNVVPEGSARIEGKTGWPSGSGERFFITAPETGEYDYNVYFEDGSCIDPRVTVK